MHRWIASNFKRKSVDFFLFFCKFRAKHRLSVNELPADRFFFLFCFAEKEKFIPQPGFLRKLDCEFPNGIQSADLPHQIRVPAVVGVIVDIQILRLDCIRTGSFRVFQVKLLKSVSKGIFLKKVILVIERDSLELSRFIIDNAPETGTSRKDRAGFIVDIIIPGTDPGTLFPGAGC